MKEYRFNENKLSIITLNIGFIIIGSGLGVMISYSILSLFIKTLPIGLGIGTFILSIPIALIPIIISHITSDIREFTKTFINEIKLDLLNAKTLKDLYEIKNKLYSEGLDENGMIRLSYPLTIKKLFDEVNYKIDILEKQR